MMVGVQSKVCWLYKTGKEVIQVMKPTLVCSSSEILGHQSFCLSFENWASALFIRLVIFPTEECTLTSVSPLLETCVILCLIAAGHFHKASVL